MVNAAAPLHVIARIRALPEHVEAVREVLVGFVAPTRAERGCLLYDLFQNRADPTDFTFVEAWADEDALDEHAKSRHLSEGRARLQGLTVGPTEVLRFSRLA
jgi:quinol monooxygenase YgiN